MRRLAGNSVLRSSTRGLFRASDNTLVIPPKTFADGSPLSGKTVQVGVSGMPGCLSYVVANDPTDPDALWITEAWDSAASHKASLSLPSVQRAIAQGRPLIAGFGERFETQPIGGHGLVPAGGHRT